MSAVHPRAAAPLGPLALLLMAGCMTPVRATAIPMGGAPARYHSGPVVLLALRDPPSGETLGEVQVEGGATLEEAMPAFIERVRLLGGNVARVDRVTPRVGVRAVTDYIQSNCGSYRFPIPCTRPYMRNVEVIDLRVEGRAFRVEATR